MIQKKRKINRTGITITHNLKVVFGSKDRSVMDFFINFRDSINFAHINHPIL
jgi:hypothetical protein